MQALNLAVAAYQIATQRRDWTAADAESASAHAALDDYLDNFGLAHKRLEQAGR